MPQKDLANQRRGGIVVLARWNAETMPRVCKAIRDEGYYYEDRLIAGLVTRHSV